MNLDKLSWSDYLNLFETILNQTTPPAPYNNPAYFDYLKLNNTRQNRWLKRGKIKDELLTVIRNLPAQEWILITEPWCGDAAHSNPFIFLMAKENHLIDLKIVLRDQPPFLIEKYLTNGGKSIPILIIRDEFGKDLAVWGPRPKPCQTLFLDLKSREADFEEQKVTLQNWYNKDNGETLQQEFLEIFDRINTPV